MRLKQKLANYREDYVYVGVPCLSFLSKELKKQAHWVLYKIPLTDRTCFWTKVPVNKFDTKGVPFYAEERFPPIEKSHP
jgi:hypothetical protein